MVTYIVRRLVVLPVLLFGIVTLVFLMTHLVPGSAIHVRLGRNATAEEVIRLKAKYGLDKSLLHQYTNYWSHLLKGDLGESIITGRHIIDDLKVYLPASIELVGLSMILIIVVSVTLGIISAVYKNSTFDIMARGIAVGGLAMPQFWLGIMLFLLLFYWLHLLPPGGRIDPSLGSPSHITGMYVLDSLLSHDFASLKSSLLHIIMPVLTLSLTRLATLTRMTRTSMLRVFGEDFIRARRAYGFSEFKIIVHYSLKNALGPITTVVGLLIGGLFAGTFMVETVFSFPGVGLYVISSIRDKDYQPIIACALLFGVLYGVINIIVDILYAGNDPRIRYGGGGR